MVQPKNKKITQVGVPTIITKVRTKKCARIKQPTYPHDQGGPTFTFYLQDKQEKKL